MALHALVRNLEVPPTNATHLGAHELSAGRCLNDAASHALSDSSLTKRELQVSGTGKDTDYNLISNEYLLCERTSLIQ